MDKKTAWKISSQSCKWCELRYSTFQIYQRFCH